MRYQTSSQLIDLGSESRGGFSLWSCAGPLWFSFLRRRCIFPTSLGASLRAILRALLLLGQADSAVWIFVNVAPPFHFSCELYQRTPGGVAQIKSGGNFTKALRLMRPGELRKDIRFGDGYARFSGAWHGPGHCMRSPCKR